MKNKHTYTNIQEKRITLPDNIVKYICYAVSVITEYTNIFGKHKTKIENLPFLFPSLEIAKEYCEIMPTYKKLHYLMIIFLNLIILHINYSMIKKNLLDILCGILIS